MQQYDLLPKITRMEPILTTRLLRLLIRTNLTQNRRKILLPLPLNRIALRRNTARRFITIGQLLLMSNLPPNLVFVPPILLVVLSLPTRRARNKPRPLQLSRRSYISSNQEVVSLKELTPRRKTQRSKLVLLEQLLQLPTSWRSEVSCRLSFASIAIQADLFCHLQFRRRLSKLSERRKS